MLTAKVSGTNMKSFKVNSADITVTGEKAGTKLTDPKLTLVSDATTSKASKTVVKATCPALGTGIVWFAPMGTTA